MDADRTSHRWAGVDLVPAIHYGGSPISIFLFFLIGLVVGGFLIKLTPALAVAFPNHDATVGDLAKDVLAVNHGRLVKELGSWNNSEVWETLCRVIVMQTGVAREQITPIARIVDDLRID